MHLQTYLQPHAAETEEMEGQKSQADFPPGFQLGHNMERGSNGSQQTTTSAAAAARAGRDKGN